MWQQPSLFAPRQSTPRAKALATFYMLAAIPADKSQCWVWLGACSRKTERRGAHQRPTIYIGIGRHARRNMHVARFLLYVMHGIRFDDPAYRDLHAAHTCHNFKCVNPQHLKWSTQSENELDKRRFAAWS
jgi:hypothetical protein